MHFQIQPICRSVTIERYFAIVHPLKHFSAKKFLLLASVVAALLYNVPKFYEFEKKVGAVRSAGDREEEVPLNEGLIVWQWVPSFIVH